MKFLVLWKLDLSLLSPHVAAAVARMAAYARPLERSGQVAARYHIVGAHGGAWVYDVTSNAELERLIALMPVYNFAHYTIYPLADMPDGDETGIAADPGEPGSGPRNRTDPALQPGPARNPDASRGLQYQAVILLMSVMQNRLARAGLLGLRERSVQVTGGHHSGSFAQRELLHKTQ